MKPTRLLLFVLLFPCLVFAGNGLREADQAFLSQQYALASQLYKGAMNSKISKEDKARACFQLGECERKLNNYSLAVMWYNRAIKTGYPDDRSWLYLGQMQQASGQYADAITSYTEYKKRVPSDPMAEEGLKSCELSVQWLKEPTCYQVYNVAQINTRDDDFSPTYSDRKHTSIVFSSKRPGQTGSSIDPLSGSLFSDLFETRVGKNGKWSTPAAVQGEVNRPASNDGAGCITKNGNHIFFTRCEQRKKAWVTCKIYYAEKRGNVWGAPVLIDFGLDAATLDSFNFRHPAVSVNEDVMVFSSDMTGSHGEHSDLWMSSFDKKTKTWSRPVNLGNTINTSGREGFPYISDDGSLYFSSDGLAGMGGLDIFKAPKIEGKEWKWGTPENMRSPINSPADDFGIVFDGKKEKGYFSSNREGSKGSDDIWAFYMKDNFVSGTVTVCEKGTPVMNAIIEMTSSDGKTVSVYTDAEGRYKFRLAHDLSYMLNVRTDSTTRSTGAGSYLALDSARRAMISTQGSKSCDDYVHDFCIPILEKDTDIQFPAVLYGLDSATLRPQSKDSLNYLYKLLVDNPSLVIEIDAHTDCRGSSGHNRRLSQARAEACVNYLISKGIAPERLKAKGWGEDHPLKLPNGQVLTEKYINSKKTQQEREALHQLNRRTVFKVLSTDYHDPHAPATVPGRDVIIRKGYFDDSGTDDATDESADPSDGN